jgi:hypothetical protein
MGSILPFSVKIDHVFPKSLTIPTGTGPVRPLTDKTLGIHATFPITKTIDLGVSGGTTGGFGNISLKLP